MVFMKTLLYPMLLSLLLTGCHCKEGKCQKEAYKIATECDPQNLDPRFARDLHSINMLHNLFDGLFKKDKEGKICLALCSSYEIFDGGKSYRFRLRESKWSNGEPVKASDFVYAWLSMLDPGSNAPYAYQLFPIVGAKEYKEGRGKKEDVKMVAENDKLLLVQLERPLAHFVELLSMHSMLPVNQKVVELNPNWAQESSTFVCNGPYRLKEWQKQHLLVLEKNPNFWQKDKVQLENVEVYTMNNETALHLFENKELNWVGSPLGTIPLDARGALADQLIVNDSAGTHFIRVNITKKPLNDKDFRHALSLAVNRQSIIERIVKGKQKEAKGLVPIFFELKTPTETVYNPELAQEIFAKVKEKLGDQIHLSLLYSNSEINHRICQVLQQNWKDVLGLDVDLRPSESKGFYHTLQSKEYDLAIGSWYADVFDPSDFLDIFKEGSSPTNSTGWENENYQALLNLSSIEMDQTTRRQILSQAQDILIEEMPMIPIYHASFLHLECGEIKGVSLSPLGHLDFVDAQ